MFRVKCRELSLISGASSYSHVYLWVFCESRLLQDYLGLVRYYRQRLGLTGIATMTLPCCENNIWASASRGTWGSSGAPGMDCRKEIIFCGKEAVLIGGYAQCQGPTPKITSRPVNTSSLPPRAPHFYMSLVDHAASVKSKTHPWTHLLVPLLGHSY